LEVRPRVPDEEILGGKGEKKGQIFIPGDLSHAAGLTQEGRRRNRRRTF